MLAVGGGSVIDGVKFLSAAANYEGEPWDILKMELEQKKEKVYHLLLYFASCNRF